MGVQCWGSESEPFQFTGKPPIQRSEADRSLAGYTGSHLGFHGYMRAVDAVISRRSGVRVMDLPDRCWRDSYDDRIVPRDAALDALRDEGFRE